jgi:hypothetical protein
MAWPNSWSCGRRAKEKRPRVLVQALISSASGELAE